MPGRTPRSRTQTLTSIKENSKDINIINLSHRKFSETEIVSLSKGLKFTPTPKFGNKKDLTADLNEFHRKLRLAEYFDGNENEDIFL